MTDTPNTQTPPVVNEADREALKPCPFCGASGDDLLLFCDPSEARDNSGPSRRVQCGRCFIEAPYYDTKAQTITAWNTRAAQPQAEQARELVELRAALMRLHELLDFEEPVGGVIEFENTTAIDEAFSKAFDTLTKEPRP